MQVEGSGGTLLKKDIYGIRESLLLRPQDQTQQNPII